ncbi:hypothetical protein [Thermobrachium celere]|uniref:Uncharacterized protein n=1 Tax=Thermobrachium celere DSM 8682 TaxID=941824 RepID=R7RQM6_9CLOT|nr:hypothetical protein [Thermobrachium celere]CDF57651.1 hypothetical protein TCEL_01565 [Thermobrachium celere DSM 8682]
MLDLIEEKLHIMRSLVERVKDNELNEAERIEINKKIEQLRLFVKAKGGYLLRMPVLSYLRKILER